MPQTASVAPVKKRRRRTIKNNVDTKKSTRLRNKRAVQLMFIDDDNLDLYLRDIANYAPLCPDDEKIVSQKILNGDEAALTQLVLANLRFVVSVARTYQHQGMSLADLVNEGNLGLIRAAKRFDHRKNFKFISYAVWWIRQAILQALAEQSRIVRLPLNRAGSIYKIGKAHSKLEQHFQRQPHSWEIAEELGICESHVKLMLQIGGRHASFDAPIMDSGNSTLHERISDEGHDMLDSAVTDISLKNELYRMLDALPARERQILKLYFGIEESTAYTLDEIGRRYNLTRERVRQIKENALAKLKQTRQKAAYIRYL